MSDTHCIVCQALRFLARPQMLDPEEVYGSDQPPGDFAMSALEEDADLCPRHEKSFLMWVVKPCGSPSTTTGRTAVSSRLHFNEDMSSEGK